MVRSHIISPLDVEVLVRAVEAVPDPELGGVSIGELGMVLAVQIVSNEADNVVVAVQLLPTFLGCPALDLIAADARRAVVQSALQVGVVATATVSFPMVDVRWSPDRISTSGTETLNDLGIAVATSTNPDPPCPRCHGHFLARRIPVGSTSCRSSAWCAQCRDVIDVLRGTNR